MRSVGLLTLILVLLSACSGPAPQAAPVLRLLEPQSGAALPAGSDVRVRGAVENAPADSVVRVIADGQELTRIPAAGALETTWRSDAPGSHALYLELVDAGNKQLARSELAFVNIAAPTATALPPTQTPVPTVPPPTVTSTPAPTAAPTTQPVTLTVNVALANLRAQPGLTGTLSGQVALGSVLTATARTPDGTWWRVISGTLPLWISAALVTPGPAALGAPATGASQGAPLNATAAVTLAPRANVAELVITVTVANLRSGPGVGYPLLGVANQGTVLPVTGRNAEGTWWQVKGATVTAWVFGELTSVSAAARNAPAVNVAPLPTASPSATSALVPLAPNATAAAPTPTADAATAGLPPCNPDNPYWAVRIHKDEGYTFCTPVPLDFVDGNSKDVMTLRWHIYGVERLELRVDPRGLDCGLGTSGFREWVPLKTENYVLKRSHFKLGGYKIGLWATLADGRVQDWGELDFCGTGA